MSLFSSENNSAIPVQLPDADILYYPSFYKQEIANQLFTTIHSETPWQQDPIKIFGKTYLQPRLYAYYSITQKEYSYSGIDLTTHSFTPTLLEIHKKLKDVCKVSFNAVLINLYRHGSDSMGWHSDDEKELGKNPIIASLTLGQERYFNLKHKTDKSLKSKLLLEHGSLLIMKGTTQHFWKHQIAKSTKKLNPRINLTFRVIH